MLDFDEKYKDQIITLQQENARFKEEVDELKKLLESRDSDIKAAKENENSLVSEVKDLEERLAKIGNQAYGINECQECIALQKQLEEESKKVGDLENELKEARKEPSASSPLPSPVSPSADAEELDESYGANEPISPGGPKRKKKKSRLSIFCG